MMYFLEYREALGGKHIIQHYGVGFLFYLFLLHHYQIIWYNSFANTFAKFYVTYRYIKRSN